MSDRICAGCALWKQAEDEPALGECTYQLPPALQELITALTNDPATLIDYERALDLPMITERHHSCSEHQKVE